MGVEQLCGVLPCEWWVEIRRHRIEGGIGKVFEAEAVQLILQIIKTSKRGCLDTILYMKA